MLCEATAEVLGECKPYSLTGSLPLVKELQDDGFDLQVAHSPIDLVGSPGCWPDDDRIGNLVACPTVWWLGVSGGFHASAFSDS